MLTFNRPLNTPDYRRVETTHSEQTNAKGVPPLLKALPEDNLPPALLVPDSPLIELLRTLSVDERKRIRHIQLTRALGYRGGFTFESAEHLFRWLTPDGRAVTDSIWRAEQYRIKSFQRPIKRVTLKVHCKGWPDGLS